LDAAAHLVRRTLGQPQQFADLDTAIDAGDEEPFGTVLLQKLEAAIDAARAARQHHDRIGLATGRLCFSRQPFHEVAETDDKGSHSEQRKRATPPAQEGAAARHEGVLASLRSTVILAGSRAIMPAMAGSGASRSSRRGPMRKGGSRAIVVGASVQSR